MIIQVNSNQMETVEGMRIEYPYILHAVSLRNTRVPWHWHEEVEFVLVETGSLKVTTLAKTYVFAAGEAFFINSNVMCAMQAAGTAETRIGSHLMHPVFLGGHYKSIFETKYLAPLLQNKRLDVVPLRGENERQRQIQRKLREAALLQGEEDREFETRNLFSQIWLLLMAEAAQSEAGAPVPQGGQERIQTMLAYIHHHYAERVTLESIAASAAISKRECTRCFARSIKCAPIEYLLEYRVEQAARLLESTQTPVTEVAQQTGFSNSAYFCKVFKQQKGLTPAAYRKGRASEVV